MKYVELPIEQMLPRIIDAREFQYRHKNPIKRKRITYVYELGFYLGGDGRIFIEDEAYPVHYGDIRFSKPGTQLNSAPKYKCYTLVFDFGENNVVYENQILDNIPPYFSTRGETAHLFEEIIRCCRSNDASEKLHCNALLMQLIFELFHSLHSKKKYSDAVRLCIGYMEENYKEGITLEKLGELSGYSHIHIMRLFRQETGQTPHEWLTGIRINRAKNLLSDSNLTLEEIADECGFRSPSHFKILFKKLCGFTPGTYRKNTSGIY
ncbi:MAG: helix-turn-helix transcriptional regulator [Ruminococcaceae bacterium]|nr:helix-turn-helix transcriptional regulator [Oscillospiraceae bacterium]